MYMEAPQCLHIVAQSERMEYLFAELEMQRHADILLLDHPQYGLDNIMSDFTLPDLRKLDAACKLNPNIESKII